MNPEAQHQAFADALAAEMEEKELTRITAEAEDEDGVGAGLSGYRPLNRPTTPPDRGGDFPVFSGGL